jgi:addiction module RelE/StbE family toxin
MDMHLTAIASLKRAGPLAILAYLAHERRLLRLRRSSRRPSTAWERLSRSGRYDMRRLKEAMLLLIANDAPLSAEWFDHPLKTEWADHRERYIDGDFLLIYQLEGNKVNFSFESARTPSFSNNPSR